MTTASEPDPSALESLDDLLSKRWVHQNEEQEVRTPPDLIEQSDDPSSSSVTITSPKKTPERDETRWNGFHLWRTESYNRQASRKIADDESRQMANRQNWIASIGQLARGWYEGEAEMDTSRQQGQELAEKNDGMTWVNMLLLTIVSAGGQLVWCLLFGNGTPYLLSIGLTKSSTSLVWLALPITGIIMQPLIGVFSDLSISRYRRRQYILLGLTILVPSMLILATSTSLSSILVDVFRTGLADWDPARQEAVNYVDKIVAVSSIVLIYLSINTLQPASRALILDAAPLSQHSRANAWNGRQTHLGNIGGYAAGYFDLSSFKPISWVGGGQFRKVAILSVVGVTICSLITCFAIKEEPREDSEGSIADGFLAKVKEAVHHIWQTTRRLPRAVRRICLVQLFAFMAWFPFLFYASEWVVEIQQRSANKVDDGVIDDRDTERGSFALLMFAIVALISGTILPYLTLSYAADTGKSVYLPGPEGESLPEEDGHTYSLVKPKLKSWKLTLRTVWTFSLLLYCIQACILTFFVRTTNQAIGLLASIGIPWSVAQWVPFALVMESVREAEAGLSPFEFEADWFAPERVRGRRESSSAFARARVQEAVTNCEPLSNTSSLSNNKQQQSRQPSSFLARGTEVARDNHQSPSRQASVGVPVPVTNQNNLGPVEMSLGATILGIHNIAMVTPQLIFALLAALVLEKGPTSTDQSSGEKAQSGTSVVWVIRMGGLAAIFAAILTRFVPLTRIERQRRGVGVNNFTEPRFDDEVTEDEEEPEISVVRS